MNNIVIFVVRHYTVKYPFCRWIFLLQKYPAAGTTNRFFLATVLRFLASINTAEHKPFFHTDWSWINPEYLHNIHPPPPKAIFVGKKFSAAKETYH